MKRSAWGVSLLLHGGIALLLIGWGWHHWRHIAKRTQPVIHAYVQLDSAIATQIEHKKPQKPQPKPTVIKHSKAKAVTKPKPEVQHQSKPRHISGATTKKATAPAPKVIRRLLMLMSARLQQQLHYPLQAKLNGIEGKVVVRFTLLTNGDLNHIRIRKKSANAALDQAALVDVKALAPFKPAIGVLPAPLPLVVPIVFELGR